MSVLRLLDANRNRAAEALRTAEDYARFVLAEGRLARELKEARHRLLAAFDGAGLTDTVLVAERDSAQDVGREETPPAERDAARTALAAVSRLTESLRVIEEYTRADRPGLAAEASRLRYQAYDLGARFSVRRPPFRLYFVMSVDRLVLPPGLPPLDCARAAVAGGADAVQLRWKGAEGARLTDLALQLVEALAGSPAVLLVNDRADVALAAGAAGVHVGEMDLSPEAARRVVGPGRMVGATAHSVAEAVKLARSGADYLGVGTIYPSAAKGTRHAAGLDLVREAAAALEIPWVAIGGMDATHAAEAVAAGAPGVAVGDAIGRSADPEAAARAIRQAVDLALGEIESRFRDHPL